MQRLSFAAAAVIGLLAAISPAFAEGGKMPRIISLSGHGEVRATPDIAYVTSGVVTQGATAAEALAANTKAMTDLFAALKDSGIEDRDVQTSNFSVQPRYDFSNNQAPQPGSLNSPNPIAVPTRATSLAKGYYGELYNASNVQIQRSIVLGKGAISTLFMDESAMMLAEAGQPGGPKTSFAMVGNQLQMMAGAGSMGNVRVTIRPPIDRAGQQVAISWTTTRGYPVTANLLSGQSNGRFKRALVVETGFEAL